MKNKCENGDFYMKFSLYELIQKFNLLHPCVCLSVRACVCSYVLSTNLLLSELDLDKRPDGGHQLPPWPAFDTTILLYVLLDAADGHVLDLSNTNIAVSDKLQ